MGLKRILYLEVCLIHKKDFVSLSAQTESPRLVRRMSQPDRKEMDQRKGSSVSFLYLEEQTNNL